MTQFELFDRRAAESVVRHAAVQAPTQALRSSARISDCGRYRYTLERDWEPNHGQRVVFVMLNPSTADAELDDPTVRRCIGFTRRWGYDRLLVLNLYAYRATNPRYLWATSDPVGPDNDETLSRELSVSMAHSTPVVAAWGAAPHARLRAEYVRGLVPGLVWQCLGTAKSGAPRHPLYLRGDAQLRSWPA